MRIVTGKYRGRHFDVPRSFKARPTTDMAKENIFNVIRGYIDLDGADALDLFTGTGSISLELLSRGCASVVGVEKDRDHARFIQQCVSKIGAQNYDLIRGDALRFLKSPGRQFDFIFADPPYAMPELAQLPELVLNSGMLRPDGIMVLEHGHDHNFADNPNFIDHRSYGSVNFSIFRANNQQQKND